MVFAFPHPRANPALNPPYLSHGDSSRDRSKHPTGAPGRHTRCSRSHAPFSSPQRQSGNRGIPAGCNPPCRSPGASQTGLPWQRAQTYDEASACAPRESAPAFREFNEKSSEPVESWYFLACDAAPSPPPGKSHPVHPAFLPAALLWSRGTASHGRWAAGQEERDAKGGQAALPRGKKQGLHHTKSFPRLQKPQLPALCPEQTGVPLGRGACPGARGVRVVLPLKCNIELLNFNSAEKAGAWHLMSARNGQREKPFKPDLFLHPWIAAETGQGCTAPPSFLLPSSAGEKN